MPVISKIVKTESYIKNSDQEKCDAEYNDYICNGEKFVRIKTYGTDNAKIRSVKQTTFIDKETAIELVNLLKESFNI